MPSESTDRFGMRVLTRDVDGWDDAWLVELDEPIHPPLRSYVEMEGGIHRIVEFAVPSVRHVVVAQQRVHSGYEETLVFPAFASGEPRYVGDTPQAIAGGDACTHVDALHDLAAGYVGLECPIEGDRCEYAMGQNQVIIHE